MDLEAVVCTRKLCELQLPRVSQHTFPASACSVWLSGYAKVLI